MPLPSEMNELQENIENAKTPRNWKVVLAYDGTDFYGWQVQPGLPTIQGQLASAIHRITGEEVLPQGSGRTDAGVHALGQVASFQLSSPIPAANLLRALNRKLPATIRALTAEVVAADFHARHSALEKSYEYRIYRGEICPPTLARYTDAVCGPLDVDAMNRAAALVIGRHDFASFAANDPEADVRSGGVEMERDCIRTITDSRWIESNELLSYSVTGNGFLHHMVRNLVGTFLDAGRGRLAAEAIVEILAAKSRSAAGPTAPARGLFLISVRY